MKHGVASVTRRRAASSVCRHNITVCEQELLWAGHWQKRGREAGRRWFFLPRVCVPTPASIKFPPKHPRVLLELPARRDPAAEVKNQQGGREEGGREPPVVPKLGMGRDGHEYFGV